MNGDQSAERDHECIDLTMDDPIIADPTGIHTESDETALETNEADTSALQAAEHDAAVDDAGSTSGSAPHSSGPDEAVFDTHSSHSSPCTSDVSDGELSILSSSQRKSKRVSTPYTPVQARSPFRKPSSVRAMQTDDTTPPHLTTTPSSLSSSHRQSSRHPRPRLYTPSRKSTPRSIKVSYESKSRSHSRTPSKLSSGKIVKREFPLVLLHVTLLPVSTRYSAESLAAILPPTVLANWKLLQEKAGPTVFERGVLIPHPREDYELLEERLLESLELKQPRILKCGHFRLSSDDEADMFDESSESDSDDERPEPCSQHGTSPDKNTQDDEETTNSDGSDVDICEDCGRRIRDGRYGDAGTGSKRWDIKIYAANGLMRAGAWAAAWREMERVDVEILPWMEERWKDELELRWEEDERQRLEQEEHDRALDEGVAGLDDARIREIYGQNPQDFSDAGVEEPSRLSVGGTTGPPATPRSRTPDGRRTTRPTPSPTSKRTTQPPEDLSFRDVLWHCARLILRDPKNMAIFALSVLVLWYSIRSAPASHPSAKVSVVSAQSKVSSAIAPSASTPAVVSQYSKVEKVQKPVEGGATGGDGEESGPVSLSVSVEESVVSAAPA